MWSSKEIAHIVKGELLGSEDSTASNAIIDSRQAREGEIFFAFAGEKVDGHDYIEAAWQKGANVVIAERERVSQRPKIDVPVDKSLILVESSLTALQVLAKAWRRKLQAKVVAITGSNGKTTTKDMVAAVLAQKYRVHKNRENQNNEIGMPLTILNAPEKTEILILEMGMRGLGQIKELCAIAEPDLGVITNIGTTHMELLGSQENIAKAKWELVDALPQDGLAIINAEDYWSVTKAEKDSHKVLFYGIKGKFHQPNLRGENIIQAGTLGTRFEVKDEDEVKHEHENAVIDKNEAKDENESTPVIAELPLPGEHNVLDALAALLVGKSLGLTLEEGCKGLKTMELSPMRLELHEGINDSMILSDVYNANPASMAASLKILCERGGDSTIAILGEMYELGSASEKGHYEVGCIAADLGVKKLITVGKLADEIARGASEKGMAKDSIYQCSTREEAIEVAKKVLFGLDAGTWVLIKASRGMKLEEVTRALQKG